MGALASATHVDALRVLGERWKGDLLGLHPNPQIGGKEGREDEDKNHEASDWSRLKHPANVVQRCCVAVEHGGCTFGGWGCYAKAAGAPARTWLPAAKVHGKLLFHHHFCFSMCRRGRVGGGSCGEWAVGALSHRGLQTLSVGNAKSPRPERATDYGKQSLGRPEAFCRVEGAIRGQYGGAFGGFSVFFF
uniref:Uncharacterized protein n=1 Tax=Eutreptiella gymnastica TaxID=73025 RepID=A0A7S4GDI4_9EUGL|mmetsp:Transcript_46588/g.78201  ORF Transcript_46588/g.78201 Transcript_46588/m.78201 type:complete len:190 (-) Transcript_46588:32-601(-)